MRHRGQGIADKMFIQLRKHPKRWLFAEIMLLNEMYSIDV